MNTESVAICSVMWMSPPSGMASSALSIRFRKTRSMQARAIVLPQAEALAPIFQPLAYAVAARVSFQKQDEL